MIGLPPHVLQQIQPHMMFNASSQSCQGSAAGGEGALGATSIPPLNLIAPPPFSLEAAAAVAGLRQIPRHQHHHHATVAAAATSSTLSTLAPDVAAAAIAAAGGNYHPLMLLQYLAQTGQATPLQQQISAVHQAGPVAAAAAWHSAAASAAAAAAASSAGSVVVPHQQALFAAGLTAATMLAAAQQQQQQQQLQQVPVKGGVLDLSSAAQQNAAKLIPLVPLGVARNSPEDLSPPGKDRPLILCCVSTVILLRPKCSVHIS